MFTAGCTVGRLQCLRQASPLEFYNVYGWFHHACPALILFNTLCKGSGQGALITTSNPMASIMGPACLLDNYLQHRWAFAEYGPLPFLLTKNRKNVKPDPKRKPSPANYRGSRSHLANRLIRLQVENHGAEVLHRTEFAMSNLGRLYGLREAHRSRRIPHSELDGARVNLESLLGERQRRA